MGSFTEESGTLYLVSLPNKLMKMRKAMKVPTAENKTGGLIQVLLPYVDRRRLASDFLKMLFSPLLMLDSYNTLSWFLQQKVPMSDK